MKMVGWKMVVANAAVSKQSLVTFIGVLNGILQPMSARGAGQDGPRGIGQGLRIVPMVSKALLAGYWYQCSEGDLAWVLDLCTQFIHSQSN